MKIITDKNLLQHRIALEEIAARQTARLCDYAEYLRAGWTDFGSIKILEQRSLKSKIRSLALTYFELAYGNYFINQDVMFRESVIDKTVNNCLKAITNQNNKDIFAYLQINIFIYLEQALKEEINKANNGS